MSAGWHSFLEGGSGVNLFPWLFQFPGATCIPWLVASFSHLFTNDFFLWLHRFFSRCGEQGLLSSCGAWSTAVVALGFCCPAACGIFPDWRSNPFSQNWQVDSYPLYAREVPLPLSSSYIAVTLRPHSYLTLPLLRILVVTLDPPR